VEERLSEDHGAEQSESGDLDQLDDLLGLEPEEAPPELDDQPEPEGAEPQAPQRTPSREERRVQALRNRLKDAEDENRRMRESWAQSMARPPAPAPQPDYTQSAEFQRQEAERVATLMPHEQAQYYAQQAERRMQEQYARARVEVGDMFDRQSYAQLCREEPMARQLSGQVEQMLQMARQSGNNPTREALYNQLVATQVRDRTRKAAATQRRNGRQAIERQTTQPGNSRSTVAPSRGNREDDYDAVVERLRNTRLGDVW
jgi:hypothetical protein